MDVFEIYLMHHPWNGADYPRPWLIVELPDGSNLVGCFPIATECYGGGCFHVPSAHPDFAATGLDHSSHILDSHIVEVPGNSVIKRRGELTGKLLAEFREFSGI
jgi:hypothetical protein